MKYRDCDISIRGITPISKDKDNEWSCDIWLTIEGNIHKITRSFYGEIRKEAREQAESEAKEVVDNILAGKISLLKLNC